MSKLTQSDLKKLESIAKVLGDAFKEVQDMVAKHESDHTPEPRRNDLKRERIEKYQRGLRSGTMRQRKNRKS